MFHDDEHDLKSLDLGTFGLGPTDLCGEFLTSGGALLVGGLRTRLLVSAVGRRGAPRRSTEVRGGARGSSEKGEDSPPAATARPRVPSPAAVARGFGVCRRGVADVTAVAMLCSRHGTPASAEGTPLDGGSGGWSIAVGHGRFGFGHSGCTCRERRGASLKS